jgi:mRNA interferase MazF
VIVTHDALNRDVSRHRRGVLTVVPLTSNVEHVYSFQVFLSREATGLQRDSKAQVEQMRALAYERFAPEPLGSLPAEHMGAIERALRLHLVLPSG